AHGKAIEFADDPLQLFLGQADLHVGGDAALLEDADSGGRELIGGENSGAHEVDCSVLEACGSTCVQIEPHTTMHARSFAGDGAKFAQALGGAPPSSLECATVLTRRTDRPARPTPHGAARWPRSPRPWDRAGRGWLPRRRQWWPYSRDQVRR